MKADMGNPNVWKTYKNGVMQLELTNGVSASSKNILLTSMNQVQFCGNIILPEETKSGFMFAIVPTQCRPIEPVILPCAFTNRSGKHYIARLIINEEGKCSLFSDYYISLEPFDPYKIYLDSISYDLASGVYGRV